MLTVYPEEVNLIEVPEQQPGNVGHCGYTEYLRQSTVMGFQAGPGGRFRA